MYIALEGIDTAGKSTQIEALKVLYPNAIFTKEPAGSKIGDKIRTLILENNLDARSEFFLFLADRSEHIKDVIAPNKDKLIISDRSAISGMSYAQEISQEDIISFNKIATQDNFPNKIIILHLQKDELIKRLSNKQNDKIEQRGIEYLLDIQEKMIVFCEKLNIEYLKIDAKEQKDIITKKITDFIGGVK
jgi:dTMP kinase